MILAIESSCDESALALFDPAKGLCGEWVHTQIALHRPYGGVVPDLASREHLVNFKHLAASAELPKWIDQVDRIAVTQGPGLAACLAVGMAFAKSLALARGLPLIPVNHLRGHAFSPFIALHQSDPAGFAEAFAVQLPHLGLIVSGGNTILFSIDENKVLRILAETVDDAAGEALDKGAKLLGLPYPGGPEIERIARDGSTKAVDFPRAIAPRNVARFSFSGLKTSLRYRLETLSDAALADGMADICASYQQAVIEQLIAKTRHSLERSSFRSLGLSGGVANNQALREAFAALAKRYRLPLHTAQRAHTGDNAGMIAFAAHVDPLAEPAAAPLPLGVEPSAPLVAES